MLIDLRVARAKHGGKAAGLGRAMRAGFAVPSGIVVPAGLPVSEVSRALPTWVDEVAVAVRSSASGEDSLQASAAGVYTSVIGVRGRDAVAAAVEEVRASVDSTRAEAYGTSRHVCMHAIVQRYVAADRGGVLFTDGENPVVVESAIGGPQPVVSGSATPRRDLVGRGTGTGAVDEGWLAEVVSLGRDLAEQFGHDVDVEWATSQDELWLLQVRPVTARLSGTGGSTGVATGPVRLVHGPEDFWRVRRGDVLVCRTTDPAWTPLLSVVAAVVTEVGGLLSHAAIVARERRVPAVVGLAGIRGTLHDGQVVTVDGTAGTVTSVR